MRPGLMVFASRALSVTGFLRGTELGWDGGGESGGWTLAGGFFQADVLAVSVGSSRLRIVGLPRERRSFLSCRSPVLRCDGRRENSDKIRRTINRINNTIPTRNNTNTARTIMIAVVLDSPFIFCCVRLSVSNEVSSTSKSNPAVRRRLCLESGGNWFWRLSERVEFCGGQATRSRVSSAIS